MHCVLAVSQSVTGRAWTARLDADAERTATALAQRFQLPELVARVLAGRGVTIENAAAEIEPTIRELLPDPSTLTDCDTLVAFLADAVEAQRRVAIFSDYDVDGATSAAVVVRTLRAFGLQPSVTIPDRVTEGYGPSVAAMDALADAGADVVLMLDCGAAAHEPVAHAKARGMKVLVIDHHPVDRVAEADAVVNPNRADDLSGLGDCAAVGVAFVAMVGLLREMRRRGVDPGLNLLDCLDCVALGTVADVVPLTALNRAFVSRGLIAFRRRTNAGLAALAEVARIHGPVEAQHLGYVLGPRINAGGRIGDAGLGTRLLTLDAPDECAAIAATLDQLNTERRAIEQAALTEADAMANGTDPVVVVAGDWHPGVVGLVAARLKERYRRPAFALALTEDGLAVGSGRSIPGVDLGAAVREAAASGRVVKGGGHAMAAGLTVPAADVDALTAWLTARLGPEVDAACAAACVSLDGVAALGSLTEALARELAAQGPWGRGRQKPVVALEAVTVERAVPVGSGDSLRVSLRSADGARGEAMAFRPHQALRARLLAARSGAVHLAVEVGHGTFRGAPRVELTIVDVAAIAEEARQAA